MRRSLVGWALATFMALAPSWVWADDQETAQRIARDLRASGQLVDYSIGVKYAEGTAWLLGRVANQEQLQRAMELTRSMEGVNDVVNKLEIKPTAQPVATQAAADLPADPGDPLAMQRQPEFSDATTAPRGEQAAASRMTAWKNSVKEAFNFKLTNFQSEEQPQAKPLPAAAMQTARPVAKPKVSAAPKPIGTTPKNTFTKTSRATPSPVVQASAAVGQPTSAPTARVAQLPTQAGGMSYASYGGGVHDQPHLPNHAWPSYAAYPNYAGVTYPKQYSPTAWPYIGPFYPYPQVPLGWRRVALEWDDGWWYLDFDNRREPRRHRGLGR